MADAPAMTPAPADSAAPADDSAGAGYSICINVAADGTLSVGVGPLESGEPGEGAEGTSPASSIREAMAMAMDIYKNNGSMPDGSDDADFASGFGKSTAPTIQKQTPSPEDMV